MDGGNGKTRIQVTLRPDVTFAGAKANIWQALGLEMVKADSHAQVHLCGAVCVGGGGRHVPRSAPRPTSDKHQD